MNLRPELPEAVRWVLESKRSRQEEKQMSSASLAQLRNRKLGDETQWHGFRWTSDKHGEMGLAA